MVVVRCSMCGWIGDERDLTNGEACPNCGYADRLCDLNEEFLLDEYELETLWSLFGDVPINDRDDIDEDFMGWPAGTNRFDVLRWFDEHYPGGVQKLMWR